MSTQCRGTTTLSKSRARRFSRILGVALLLAGLPAPSWCATGADAGQPGKRVLRIAMIPVTSTAESLAAAVMVQAALETDPACEMIEREQIGAVLQEKALSADLARQEVESLGATLQADGFLFLEIIAHEKRKRLHLTAVEAQSGTLVLSRLLNAGSGDAPGRDIREAAADALRRIRTPAAAKHHVGWLGVSPGATGETWLRASRILTALVEMHLSELPGVAMLDRRRLQRVGEEAFISGLDQNLLPSVILLDARMRQMDVGGRLELNLRARWPSGGAVTNMQTQTHLDKLEQSAQSLADAAAALLALPPPAAAVPELTPDEITLLARRTETLLASRSWTEAQESAEALMALAPTRQHHRVMLFMALDKVSEDMRKRLGEAPELDEGTMLGLMRRAVEVRTRYIEDLNDKPVSGDMIVVFETDYRSRPAQPTDTQEIRQKLQALAGAEERMFQAQLATGERYCRDYGYPFLLLRALLQRTRQLAQYQPENPAAQAAILRQAVAGFKRAQKLDIRPPQVAVELLFETVSHEICWYCGNDPQRSELFRAYLAELAGDSNAWCRLAAGRGAYSARNQELPHLVPDDMPDNQELMRRAARSVRHEILPELLSESHPRLKYKQERQTKYNDLLEKGLLLDLFAPVEGGQRRRMLKVDLRSDPVRLADLAAILAMTEKLDWPRHTYILQERTRSNIRRALAATGPRKAPAQSQPAAAAAARPADAPPPAAPKPSPWDDYRVMRAGKGYQRGQDKPDRDNGVAHARDQQWLFLYPAGDLLHVADVQAWKNKHEPLKVRLLRLRLPDCQVETDRTLSLECPVPDVLTTEVHGFAWGAGNYFLATPRGLLIIDDKTFTTRRLTTREGLPCNRVTAVAWFDNALFLSTYAEAEGSASSLLRMDPASGAFEELAAQRTSSRRTPLDGCRFEVTDMLPDPARDRLLMRIKWKTACGLEIWEWRPAAKSLACIQDNSTRDNVYWLPSSRNHAQVGGHPKAFMPSDNTLVNLPSADANQRLACYGDTVFTLESWWVSKEEPRAALLARTGCPVARRAKTDDGYPMIYLIGATTTDAGVVLVNIFGETFLIQRRNQP
ncbi:MAG: hypothetical protein ACOYD3_06225 [Kiritimatiellia bacterium]|jgi:hypothetical protein